MKRILLVLLIAALAGLFGTGCDDDTTTTVITRSGGGGGGGEPPPEVCPETDYNPVIEPANFTASTTINNPFYSLAPGQKFIYEGDTEAGFEHNEVAVTHLVKTLMGVTCIVVKDKSWITPTGGTAYLEEETLDYYAQDNAGNVWYFGEASKQFDPSTGLVISTDGSWEAGVACAKPGIVMESNPRVDDMYRLEYQEGVAEDWALVLSLTETRTVPYSPPGPPSRGTFTNCLMTEEWTPLDSPPQVEHKYYASGVGLIEIVGVEGISEDVKLIAIGTTTE